MIVSNLIRIFSYCICLSLIPSLTYAQVSSKTIKKGTFSFIREDLNEITDEHHALVPFFEKLKALVVSQNQPGVNSTTPNIVSIMHIGDSHIQAGFFTVTIMNRLQQRFGSAGRGLIFPLKLARTNEPFDYLIRSDSKWDRSLCIRPTHSMPMGLGGLSIKTDDDNVTFNIGASVTGKVDHSFNKIMVFHHERAPELDVVDTNIGYHKEKSPYPFASIIKLDNPVNRLDLSSASHLKTDSAIYYGFNLENGKSGILYHAVGLNGAQFRHYAGVEQFAQQMAILTPQLFVFSLGTNEAFRGKLVEKRFFAEIDRIIAPIRQANPHASILITTPPDCLAMSAAETKNSNENIAHVRQALIRYATSKGYACWDLYSILGGDNSAYKLYQAGYLADDGTHFFKNGYTVLGNLFYDALIRNYTAYVQRRSR